MNYYNLLFLFILYNINKLGDFMRRTTKLNNLILKQMKQIFYSKEKEYIDWMGFKITNENVPSYHHIEKAENLRNKKEKDDATIENGAYLGKKSHELLHQIEYIDYELYESWNYLFSIINNMKVYPINDVLKCMKELREKSLNICNNKKMKQELLKLKK